MLGHHPRRLSALSQEEIKTLAAILSLPLRLLDPTTGTPSDLWLAEQSRRIAAKAFPRSLCRPENWLSRLTMSANRHLGVTLEDLVPQCAVLCAAHHALNPWVVRRAFFLVSQEVTGRLDALRVYLARPGRYNNYPNNNSSSSSSSSTKNKRPKRVLTGETIGEIQGLVDRLGGVAALWMAPAVLARIGGEDGGGDGLLCPRPRQLFRIESACEACIVAAVGADAQALCDLRAGLLGRAHKRKGREPVLLRLVEAWIERIEGGGREILQESERAAKVVKRVRRAVHERRQETRKRPQSSGRGGRSRKGGRGSQGKQLLSWSSIQPFPSGPFSSTATFTPSWNQRGQSDNDSTVRLAVDDNPSSRPQNLSSRSSETDASWKTDTIADIVDAHGVDDEDVDEFDEADPHATNRLQDASSRWYSAFSEAGEQHPAFRQSAADIEASWAAAAAAAAADRSRFAQSAVPSPLRFRVSSSDADWRLPFEDGDEEEEEEEEEEDHFDPTQWTDISVRTLATKSTANGQRRNSPVPTVPNIPSVYRAPQILSDYASSNVVHGISWGGAGTVVASSVYSNDDTAMPHPPADAARTQPHSRPVAPIKPGSNFLSPRAPPAMPCLVASSQSTSCWSGLGFHQTTATTSSSSHQRRSPGSSPNRSRQATSTSHTSSAPSSGFQAALDSLNQLSFKEYSSHGPGTVFGGQIPEGTVLPGESVSAVGAQGGMRPVSHA